jgi:hypothetical protein|tara:strand:+ start:3379 stop:3981 length:603 start_codon:yes stop_codon:yes gene_type:complete
MPDPLAQQPPPAQDPYGTNIGYTPQRQLDLDPMMSKHLDVSDILIRLKNTLLGLEYDDEEDEWKPVLTLVGYDKEGNEVMAKEGPLMDPKEIRVTISYLQMFLNSNTFLSQVDTERINDIMWDVSKKLSILFYNLRKKIAPHERDMLWGMIEYPILLGLSRAGNKITLDAVSKMQQSHEIIQASPKTPTPGEKEFKILGW